MKNTVVITRHVALVQHMTEIGLIEKGAKVIEHASVDEVKGKDVIGILPLSLAVHAKSITEVPLAIPADLRGKELTIEQVRQLAGKPVTYKVDYVS